MNTYFRTSYINTFSNKTKYSTDHNSFHTSPFYLSHLNTHARIHSLTFSYIHILVHNTRAHLTHSSSHPSYSASAASVLRAVEAQRGARQLRAGRSSRTWARPSVARAAAVVVAAPATLAAETEAEVYS